MKQEKFNSRLGFILVSAGCAIGLGNVWKFPYICGENGGAAFIVIYILCLLLLGLPILMCEYAIGRASGHSLMKAYNTLQPEGTHWSKVKGFCFAGNYLLMMFYTMVAGWMMYYAYLATKGSFEGKDTEGIEKIHDVMLDSPGVMLFWTFVIILLAFGVCALGLNNGVERITKIMMMLLITLMIVMAIRSVTLKGASEGVRFYLVPDFSKLLDNGIGNVVFAAMTHAFFTLSVGIGSMEIFGSYLTKERRLVGEAISVTCIDTFVAITAGIIIIPSCFAYGIEPDAGPSLLFVTLPNVFNHMSGGKIWALCFFVFMTFAALSTVIAVFENIVKMTDDLTDWGRKKSILINIVGISVLSIPAVLGYNILSDIKPMGANSTIMDFEDFLVSYNILPLGSLVAVLFCVRKNGWGWNNFVDEVNTGKGKALSNKLRAYVTFVIPAVMVLIYMKGYYDMFKPMGNVTLAVWMTIAVLLLLGVAYIALSPAKQNSKVK
ncbi:MAG: sodium-dependent transporter [Wujia sp.]